MRGIVRRWVNWLVALVVCAALAVGPLAPAGSPAQAAGPGQAAATEKLIVDAADSAALAQLAAQRAELLADYGAFSLWRVAAAQAPALRLRAGVSAQPDFDTIPLRGAVIDTRPGALDHVVPPGLRQSLVASQQFWIVQFVGPVRDDWLKHLSSLGLEIVSYLPHNAYVVWGDAAALAQVDEWASKDSAVQWTGPYHPAYRLAPSLQALAAAETLVQVTVQFYTTAAVDQSLARLLALGGPPVKAPEKILTFTNLTLPLPASQLAAVANWPDVFNVEPWSAPVRHDEIQGQIVAGNIISSAGNIVASGPGYLAWLATKGFTTTAAAYPLVSVVDDGIDNGSTNPLHPDFHTLGVLTATSRLLFNTNCTSDASANAVGGHGNINAGIIAAYNNLSGAPHVDANGYRLGLGISPYGRVGGTKIFRNVGGSYDDSGCGGTDSGVVQASYAAGAAFTSNSWGADVGGAYNASAQAYDALTRDASTITGGSQQMLHIFSAGNAGGGANTIGSPGTAKNVLTVGATENVRDHGVTDGCGFSSSDDADDIATFSSRGPTDDSRIKPDLMAPGVHVQGPASQDPGFDGTGVCGASGGGNYYPPSQTLYTWSSGTSHSAPAVAGAASLAYEYYGRVLNHGQTPSPAMLKALLLNSPRYLDGAGTGGTLPSNNQGWGDVNLGTLFDGLPRHLLDQSLLFAATGEDYLATGEIISTTQPFRVSLVWTDAPGPTTGNAYVNDLNLEVTVGGVTYKGNVFSGAHSTSGGAFDARNNVENVFIPAGVSGPFAVRVIAANLAGDGVPGNADGTDQDFALVVYNAAVAPQALLTAAGTSFSDAAGNNDGVVDPGETIALDVALTNAGSLTATAVSGVLGVAGGGATMIQPNAAYPNLAPAATTTNTTPYLASVSPAQPCGQPLTLALTANYNVSRTLQYTYTVPVGAPVTALAESFDGVTAPALPAGWTATVLAGSVAPWRTVTTSPDTAPNSIFASGFITVSDNVLSTPAFNVTTAAAQVTFRNQYNLETSATLGFDGGVLEIKIGGGVFTDVVSAGGSFVAGGYNKIISSSYNSPLRGRAAWSGDSGGYTTTIVNLPPAAAGQSVQLRWRVGTDSSVLSTGQWVDTVTLSDGYACDLGPLVSFSSAAYSVNETAPSALITATLNEVLTETVTVAYATSNNTALAGSDYVAASGTLTFTPGQTAANFVLPLLDDELLEGSEALTLTLSNNVNAGLGTPHTASLTLLDDEQAGVSLAPPSASQAGLPGAVVTHSLTLTNTGTITDNFTVAFAGGTFTATLPATVAPLAPGASNALVVLVQIPPGTASGTNSQSTITVTSQADPTQTATATLTTTVGVGHLKVYLPLVSR